MWRLKYLKINGQDMRKFGTYIRTRIEKMVGLNITTMRPILGCTKEILQLTTDIRGTELVGRFPSGVRFPPILLGGMHVVFEGLNPVFKPVGSHKNSHSTTGFEHFYPIS